MEFPALLLNPCSSHRVKIPSETPHLFPLPCRHGNSFLETIRTPRFEPGPAASDTGAEAPAARCAPHARERWPRPRPPRAGNVGETTTPREGKACLTCTAGNVARGSTPTGLRSRSGSDGESAHPAACPCSVGSAVLFGRGW